MRNIFAFVLVLLLPYCASAQVVKFKGRLYIMGDGGVLVEKPVPVGPYSPIAVTLQPGLVQYMQTINSSPAVTANSTAFTFSIWFEPNVDSTRCIISGPNACILVERKFGGTMHIAGNNSSGQTVLDAVTSLSSGLNTWTHMMFCCDLSQSSSTMKCVMNGVTDPGMTINNYSNNAAGVFNFGNTGTLWAIGAFVGGGELWPGCVQELWFDLGTYLDITTAPNQAKFSTGAGLGTPISLGSDGSLPTGTAPPLYFKNPPATFQVNSGSASLPLWAEQNGSFNSCSFP